MASSNFHSSIVSSIEEAIKRLGLPPCQVILSPTKDSIKGDLCTNISLQLHSHYKDEPLAQLTSRISEHISTNPYISSTTAEKNGFLNITLSPKAFQERYSQLLNPKPTPKGLPWKLIEIVSANPTGYLHIGHARNGIYSDTLCNIFERLGYPVYREYLVNDSGAQMKSFVSSFVTLLNLRRGTLSSEGMKFLDQCQYKGQDMEDCIEYLMSHNPEQISQITNQVPALNSPQYQELKALIVDYFLHKIKELLGLYDIEIRHWRYESEFINSESISHMLRSLGTNTIRNDGALWLNIPEKPEVLIKKDGTHTYFMQDIIYHNMKFDIIGKEGEIINVLGADHYGHIDKLMGYVGIRNLDEEDKIRFVCIQLVRLISNGEAVKMSKRNSTVIYWKDLKEFMSAEEVRWFFVSQPANSPLEIDLNRLKNKDYNNPVYYVMYAYSRIQQILKKADSTLYLNPNISFENLNEQERAIFVDLVRFDDLLEGITKNLAPHKLPQYLFKLAQRFHSYYETESILNCDPSLLPQKLALLEATARTIREGLSLMKIKAKEIL